MKCNGSCGIRYTKNTKVNKFMAAAIIAAVLLLAAAGNLITDSITGINKPVEKNANGANMISGIDFYD